MRKKFDKVYQFKIILKKVKPPIWRRIQVPETYTFWDLSVAINDSMGWSGLSLNEFIINNPLTYDKVSIEIPDEDEIYEREIFSVFKEKIAKWFSLENNKAKYIYNYNDYWEHEIILEKILPKNKNVKYPLCIKGKRECPPEDCGGPLGYKLFLEAFKNPEHPKHKECLETVREDFDPEYFNPDDVYFEDPEKRKKTFKDFY